MSKPSKKPTCAVIEMTEVMEQLISKVASMPHIESSHDDCLLVRDAKGRKRLKVELVFDLEVDE
ncbi:MAG: hypothetical protein PHS54_00710 [Clostridia bacterium]|nr:hypothetical protein [Clostridia bacterium]